MILKTTLKKRILIAAILLIAFSPAIFFADAFHPRETEVNYPTLPGNLTLTPDTSLPELLNYVFTFFVVIGGLLAFAIIVYAGFLFMTSGANPGLRSQAQDKIKNALLGIVLLLSSYIIFTTINPELVLLYTRGGGLNISSNINALIPQISGVLDENIDYATLRYGGIIVFEKNSSLGKEGKSETIFHNVADISNENYINTYTVASNFQKNLSGISAVRILGDCIVKLINSNGTQSPDISSSPEQLLVGNFSDFDEKVQGITFTQKNCLGHSAKIFESVTYNKGSLQNTNGSLTLLTNEPDLTGRLFVNSLGTTRVAEHIKSVRFAFQPNDPSPSTLYIKLCKTNGDCFPRISYGNEPDVSTWGNDLATTAVSFGFATSTISTYRQAGVTLYSEPEFIKGKSEIFIVSDPNLEPSFIGNDQASAIKIIGKYFVRLQENTSTGGAAIWFDNTNPESPRVITYARKSGWMDSNKNGKQDATEASYDGLFTDMDTPLTKSGSSLAEVLDNYCAEYKKDGDGHMTLKEGCKTFDNMISSISIYVRSTDFATFFPVPITPPMTCDNSDDKNLCKL